MYHWFLSRLKGVSIATKEHQTLHLRYLYEGQEYEVWLPFERRLVSKMLNQTFIVFNPENNDTRRIQQQPGIPYMVTPGNLGASGGYITTIHREKEIAKDQKVDLY